MAYIGTLPNKGQNRKLDDISSSFNGSTTTFDLQVDSQNVFPGIATSLLLSVGGVIQEPGTAFTLGANGRQITFTAAPESDDDFFGVVLGAAIDVGTPADASVTTATLANRAVTQAKLAENSVGGSKVRANVLSSGSIYTANIAGNAYVTRGFAVGYTDGRVPQANLDVKNNVYIGGATTIAGAATLSSTADVTGKLTSSSVTPAFYGANVTGNVSVTRSLAVGYTDGRVPQANLDVKGNTSISGLTTFGSTIKILGGSPGADKVLTSDADGDASWAAAAGGGSWTLISSSDLGSGTPSESTLTGIDTTYDTYVYVMSALTFSADNQGLFMRIGAGGTPGTTDAKYAQHATMVTSTSHLYSGSDGKDNNHWSIGGDHGSGAGESVNGTVWFYNTGGSQDEYISAYGQINTWLNTTNPSTPTFDIKGGGAIFGYGATSFAWDRIQIICQSGTFTDGRVTLWGIKHS